MRLCWSVWGLCWPIFGLRWPVLELRWSVLGARLGHLRATLNRLEAMLAQHARRNARTRTKTQTKTKTSQKKPKTPCYGGFPPGSSQVPPRFAPGSSQVGPFSREGQVRPVKRKNLRLEHSPMDRHKQQKTGRGPPGTRAPPSQAPGDTGHEANNTKRSQRST